MTYIIPSQQSKKHLQDNKGEFSGTIYQSKNISLDDEGYITLAPTPVSFYSTDDDANFNDSDAIYPCDTDLFLNSDEVFSGSIDADFNLTTRAADTNRPTPGVEDDVIFFNDVEVVSDGSGVLKYRSASTTWTDITSSSISSTGPGVLTVYHAANSLAYGRGNTVKFVNTSWVTNATSLTLPSEYKITSMTANGNTLYIATRSNAGGEAKIFTINTIQANPDSVYGCGANELPTITTFKSSIIGLTSLGQLVRFTGGGFQQLAQLPVYNTPFQWGDALNDYSTISNRGLFVDGDLVYIHLTSYMRAGYTKYLPYFPSGLWVYDDTNGALYNRSSVSFTKVQTFTQASVTISAANNTLTLTSGNLNSVVTGMPFIYKLTSGSEIGGLKALKTYFVIKDSSTVFKLAETYADAVANTPIDISGSIPAAADFFIFQTNDYGWTFMEQNRLSVAVLPNTQYDSELFANVCFTGEAGAKTAVATAKTTLTVLMPALPNRGYFITPRFESDQVEDVFQGIIVKHKPLKGDDKLIVKYKVTDYTDYPIVSPNGKTKTVGTWTDTDTFTTTYDLSDVVAGDEVEIVSGVGAGHIAHVSSISESSGTYTVNLDEAFPFAVNTDQMYFVVDKWTYLTEFNASTSTNSKGYSEAQMFATGPFIQFKIEMRGIGVKVKELQVAHQTDKTVSLYN